MSPLWSAFNLALLDNGWELQTQPGDFCLKRGQEKLAPAGLVRGLKSGALSESDFRKLIGRLEIGAPSPGPCRRQPCHARGCSPSPSRSRTPWSGGRSSFLPHPGPGPDRLHPVLRQSRTDSAACRRQGQAEVEEERLTWCT